MVIFFQGTHASTHIDHHTCTFVAENRREYAFGIRAGERVVIGVTNAGRLDFHQHFTGLRTLQIHFFDGQWRAGFPGDGSFGFHVCSVVWKITCYRKCNSALFCGSFLADHIRTFGRHEDEFFRVYFGIAFEF